MTIECLEKQTGDKPSHAVIWLHGLGADGHDFAGIVDELDLPSSSAVRFIFPHAPMRPITVNGGMVMRGWYDITHIPATLDESVRIAEDVQGIEASANIVRQLIQQENARGISDENIFIAGFSQGGAVALYTATRHPQKLAGVIALSTYLPDAKNGQTATTKQSRNTPIFFAHGNSDEIIPLATANHSQQQIKQWGYRVSWQTYDMAHALHPQEIVDISRFLSNNLL